MTAARRKAHVVVSSDAIATALRRRHGAIDEAARDLNVVPKTIRRRLERDPKLRRLATGLVEEVLDACESHLVREVKRGNLTAVLFYLSRRGGARGFGARVQLTNDSARELVLFLPASDLNIREARQS